MGEWHWSKPKFHEVLLVWSLVNPARKQSHKKQEGVKQVIAAPGWITVTCRVYINT